jgi:hypothetical protein
MILMSLRGGDGSGDYSVQLWWLFGCELVVSEFTIAE